MEEYSELIAEVLTEQPATEPLSEADKQVLFEQTAPLLAKVINHGKTIKEKRGGNNFRLDCLLVNGEGTMKLANFLNDRHLPEVEQATGFSKVRFITFDHVLDHSTKKLAGLINLELILPLNTSGEILDKHKTIEQFTTLKNLKRL